MFKYKNYIAHIEFDDEEEISHGEIMNVRDMITFQRQTVIDSIEDYLEFCAACHEKPEKPFSGKFNLRISPELHPEAYIRAKRKGKSLNQWVADALRQSVLTSHQ